ncbi:MAG: hypothetical protein Pg6C_12310 [Treponemataceae bacterium]|nr:MAG: hypothetical protein Pg6C_12310 [Treponemataceae bacterium]
MRFFLSVFKNFFTAIPISHVSSLMLYYSGVEKAVSRDEETLNTYFSLPHLFNCPDEPIKHGIVLKTGGMGEEQESVAGNKNILLLPEVEREDDIPPEDIYPLTGILLEIYGSKSAIFTGIRFAGIKHDCRENGAVMPVLFINPEQLVETMVYQLYKGKI